MWMDIAKDTDTGPGDLKSEDEDTVYDRNLDNRRNPFVEMQMESRLMLTEEESLCGIWNWRPQFLRNYDSKSTFTTSFVALGILHGAVWSYFTSSISTMEKRLHITSETSGGLLATNELFQLIVFIILSYFPVKSRRLKIMITGAILFALSSFLLASHQFIFGSGNSALRLTNEYVQNHGGKTMDNKNSSFPEENDDLVPTSYTPLCLPEVELFNKSSSDDCNFGEYGSFIPIWLVFMSQAMFGVGSMLFLSSGGPYADDEVMPKEIPMLFAITWALRLLGPFLGYIMASWFLKFFISMSSTTDLEISDPRWMGAWWLGWLNLFIFMTAFTFVISLYPSQSPKEYLKEGAMSLETGPSVLTLHSSSFTINTAEMKASNTLPRVKDLGKTLISFMMNKVSFFLTISVIFHVLGTLGYWAFFPKYLEVAFHTSAHMAALLTALVGVGMNASGLILSGAYMTEKTPNARNVTLWTVVCTFTHVLILTILTQFACDSGDIKIQQLLPATTTAMPPESFYSPSTTIPPTIAMTTDAQSIISENSSFESTTTTTSSPINASERRKRSTGDVLLLMNCSNHCNCSPGPFMPVCDINEHRLFYSACLAGCPDIPENGQFKKCSCAFSNSTVQEGFCPETGSSCTAGFYIVLGLTAISQFLTSSTVVGRMLLYYRSVPNEAKRGVTSFATLFISVFAICGFLIYGSIIDGACHIWEHTCSKTAGHCWHYSDAKLRYGYNLTAASLVFLGGCFDVLLWREVKLKDVKLYDGDIVNPAKRPSTTGEFTTSRELGNFPADS